jgi:hypothetical protein
MESQEAVKAPELILTAANVPFTTQSAAKSAVVKKGLDRNVHDTIQIEGGWAIIEVEPKVKPEKYYKVRFHAKSHANDPDDVMLSVNGEVLLMRREKEVIIPGRFKECADHAVFPQYRQVPGKQRKLVAQIRIYNYDTLGDATEEDFKNQVVEGNKVTKQNLIKFGPDVAPEDVE